MPVSISIASFLVQNDDTRLASRSTAALKLPPVRRRWVLVRFLGDSCAHSFGYPQFTVSKGSGSLPECVLRVGVSFCGCCRPVGSFFAFYPTISAVWRRWETVTSWIHIYIYIYIHTDESLLFADDRNILGAHFSTSLASLLWNTKLFIKE